MRYASDGIRGLIETLDATTQEAEVPKEEMTTMNAHLPGELEEAEEIMVEAMAEKSMRSVTGGDSVSGLNRATGQTDFTSDALH